MISDKTVIAIIPARGGSKGLPRKNLMILAGKPLIAWTIECAFRSSYIDRVILTSEDPEIMDVASSFGCEVPFRRPAELATDDASGMSVVAHTLREVSDGEVVVLLQPTSPLRRAEDIDACLEIVGRGHAPSCVSVAPVKHPPEHMFTISQSSVLVPVVTDRVIPPRRQDLPPYVALNGAVYVALRKVLTTSNTYIVPGVAGYLMPPERSIDIDMESDFRYVEWLLKNRGETCKQLR